MIHRPKLGLRCCETLLTAVTPTRHSLFINRHVHVLSVVIKISIMSSVSHCQHISSRLLQTVFHSTCISQLWEILITHSLLLVSYFVCIVCSIARVQHISRHHYIHPFNFTDVWCGKTDGYRFISSTKVSDTEWCGFFIVSLDNFLNNSRSACEMGKWKPLTLT